MSSFHSLTVVYSPQVPRGSAKARAIKKACNKWGLHHVGTNADRDKACRALSNTPGVDRVVVTFVTEHNDSTWRKGRKS